MVSREMERSIFPKAIEKNAETTRKMSSRHTHATNYSMENWGKRIEWAKE